MEGNLSSFHKCPQLEYLDLRETGAEGSATSLVEVAYWFKFCPDVLPLLPLPPQLQLMLLLLLLC